MLQWLKRLFSKNNTASQNSNVHQKTFDITDSSKSVFEQLTDQLISETVGQNGSMHKLFDRLVKGYDVSRNPIGIDDAKRILFILIGNAVEKRKVFAGRIEKSVVEAGLFERYYSNLQDISILTIEADKNMQKMKRARDRFIYEATIYKKLTGRSYIAEHLPTDEELKKIKEELNPSVDASAPDLNIKSDKWNELDSEGGEADEPIVTDEEESD